jgi:hypothetical protein
MGIDRVPPGLHGIGDESHDDAAAISARQILETSLAAIENKTWLARQSPGIPYSLSGRAPS